MLSPVVSLELASRTKTSDDPGYTSNFSKVMENSRMCLPLAMLLGPRGGRHQKGAGAEFGMHAVSGCSSVSAAIGVIDG